MKNVLFHLSEFSCLKNGKLNFSIVATITLHFVSLTLFLSCFKGIMMRQTYWGYMSQMPKKRKATWWLNIIYLKLASHHKLLVIPVQGPSRISFLFLHLPSLSAVFFTLIHCRTKFPTGVCTVTSLKTCNILWVGWSQYASPYCVIMGKASPVICGLWGPPNCFM